MCEMCCQRSAEKDDYDHDERCCKQECQERRERGGLHSYPRTNKYQPLSFLKLYYKACGVGERRRTTIFSHTIPISLVFFIPGFGLGFDLTRRTPAFAIGRQRTLYSIWSPATGMRSLERVETGLATRVGKER